MSFTQFIENTPATGSVAMYDLKEMLKAAGWTVESSSDGTTYNASGDQITGGGSGANGMANTNAWFRISNPDGVEYVIQRGTSNRMWRIKASAVATFTGGSPGATQVPSATDEGVMLGSGTDASPTFELLFNTDASYRHKGGADNASPYGFWSAAFPTGGGATNHFFGHEPLTGVEPTDGSPFITYCGPTTPSASNLAAESQSASGTRCFGYRANATPASAEYQVVNAMTYESFSRRVVPAGLPVNPITTEDGGFPIPFGRGAPVSNPGWKGVSTMAKWTGVGRADGDTFTVSSTRDRIVFGEVSVPWNGAVPVV